MTNSFVHPRAMHNHLFCYGTLCIPGVMRRVSGVIPEACPAVLADYACYALEGLVYPGIVPKKGTQVSGVLYLGLSRAQLIRLDAYEGDQYLRRRVKVASDHEHRVQAWTYVLHPRYYHRLSATGWSLEQFRREQLQTYISNSHNKISGLHGRDTNQSR